MPHSVIIIGGGFAGVEAAWAAAERGSQVTLYEMRPKRMTAVHRTGDLAELVCSNSFKSTLLTNASGLLKEEMRRLGSLILPIAWKHRVPAGEALAVDREPFAREVTERVESHPRITVIHDEVCDLPAGRPLIIATGPLTSVRLSERLREIAGESLYFYDAVAPTVTLDSLDMSRIFRASRRGKGVRESSGEGVQGSGSGVRGSAGEPPPTPTPEHPNTPTPEHLNTRTPEHLNTRTPEHLNTRTPEHLNTRTPEHLNTPTPEHPNTRTPEHLNTRTPEHLNTESEDYLNCPFTKEEYRAFWRELASAETAPAHNPEDEKIIYFEMCMPVEEMARRGERTLAFGPMKPIGLTDPRTGRRPWAVAQLRQENRDGTLWGLVGFQSRLKWGEQKRVFQMIPGLENAEFVRFGVMHRNTYVNAPATLGLDMQMRAHPGIYLAGQITGVEGYLESAAIGLVAGLNAHRALNGLPPVVPPRETALGSLCHYLVETDPRRFAPMNANFGVMPDLPQPIRDKREKARRKSERALAALDRFIAEL